MERAAVLMCPPRLAETRAGEKNIFYATPERTLSASSVGQRGLRPHLLCDDGEKYMLSLGIPPPPRIGGCSYEQEVRFKPRKPRTHESVMQRHQYFRGA